MEGQTWRFINNHHTAHHPELIEVSNRYGAKKNKPTDTAAYNIKMGGIDRADKLVSYYSSPRKTVRMYKNVLFHLLDLSVWNSFYIYKQLHKKCTFLHFRESLIKSLIQLPNGIREGKDLQNKKVSLGRPLSRKNDFSLNWDNVRHPALCPTCVEAYDENI